MMSDAIHQFAKQLTVELSIENAEALGTYDRYIVAGMGGSHLAADLIKMWDETIPLTVHSDYGLPAVPEEERERTLVIASSYSGNTEETIDAYYAARKEGYAVACLAVGGRLLELAAQHEVPYVRLPDFSIQPRSALGLSARAILTLMRGDEALKELAELAKTLQPDEYERSGRELADKMQGKVPVIYASRRNGPLAYNWKIKFNETGKIPAFYNVLPELNHNEMTGFDVQEGSDILSEKFIFIFLQDDTDHPRIQKRMEILEELYMDRGLEVISIDIGDVDVHQKTFSALLLADWAAVATAELYGLESEQVPMVEEFKKLMV